MARKVRAVAFSLLARVILAIQDCANAAYLPVDVILQRPAGAERDAVVSLEVSALRFSHLRDQIEEFLGTHDFPIFFMMTS